MTAHLTNIGIPNSLAQEIQYLEDGGTKTMLVVAGLLPGMTEMTSNMDPQYILPAIAYGTQRATEDLEKIKAFWDSGGSRRCALPGVGSSSRPSEESRVHGQSARRVYARRAGLRALPCDPHVSGALPRVPRVRSGFSELIPRDTQSILSKYMKRVQAWLSRPRCRQRVKDSPRWISAPSTASLACSAARHLAAPD